MSGKRLAPETLVAVADRFKVLAEPARLSVLNELRSGPRSVSGLIDATGLSQANLSKHLQLLHAHGFVSRQRQGLFTIYRLADRSVFALCDIMCGQLKRRADEQVTRLRQVSGAAG
jgi:DNA-binding transcriptional ArsR family regulator